MKNIILGLFLLFSSNVFNVNSLNATSAVMIDGCSGRVLVGKNENKIMSNASTTKILTCIIALEMCDASEIVEVSKYASTMPDVQLNIKEGQRFYLKDLLYSLMLESHNDVAVAIAEHVAGNVEEFSKLMNDKARELGCYNTNFITPNGLDAENEKGIHSTTAYDLSLLMKYCINNDEFIEITQTKSHTFNDIDGDVTYTVYNKNALLSEGIGVVSGKTGFTGKAGYCYVGACEDKGRKFVFALLGCGWPPEKNKKWIDSRALIKYAKENYQLLKYEEVIIDEEKLSDVKIVNGVKEKIKISMGDIGNGSVLAKNTEKPDVKYHIPELIYAPIEKGDIIGRIDYKLEEKIVHSVMLYSDETVEEKSYRWCVKNVLNKVLFNQ